MSDLLFGAIRLAPSVRIHDDRFALSIVQAGHSNGLYVYVRSGIPQPHVMKILQERDLLGSVFVPFMMVESSPCDTAHELITPYVEPNWTLDVARSTWQRIGCWLDAVLQLHDVDNITLFVLEADETECDEVALTSSGLTDLVVKEIEATGFLPQLCVHVLRPAADRPNSYP